MLKENKGKIVVTSLIILLPVIAGVYFWGKLPDPMATHFNFDNEANGWSPKVFAVFGLPLFLLAIHAVCLAATTLDPKGKNIHGKMLQMVMLICPVCSIGCSIQIYGYALGMDVDGRMLAHLLLGVIFIIIGNYIPKCRHNYTVGIRLPWTLADEENWNSTHHLAGWLYMAAGLVCLLNIWLRIGWLAFVAIMAAALIPAGYSLLLYVKKK